MSISQAAARVYAKALFDIAAVTASTAQVAEELHLVHAAINGLDPEFQHFFTMPVMSPDDKRQVVTAAFGSRVGRPVMGLLNVLTDKRRELLLPSIVARYDDLMDEAENRVQANVTSARALDPALVNELQAALQKRLQRPVVLQARIDPDLIGGIRVGVGDLVLDGTLRRRLADMGRTLAATN